MNWCLINRRNIIQVFSVTKKISSYYETGSTFSNYWVIYRKLLYSAPSAYGLAGTSKTAEPQYYRKNEYNKNHTIHRAKIAANTFNKIQKQRQHPLYPNASATRWPSDPFNTRHKVHWNGLEKAHVAPFWWSPPSFKKKGNSIYVMCVLLSRLAGCWNNLPGRRIDPPIPYGPALLSIYKVLRSFCCLGLDGFLPIEKKKIFLIYWRSARYFRGWFAQLADETSWPSVPFGTTLIFHLQGLAKLLLFGFGWIPSDSKEKDFFNLLAISALFPWVVRTTRRRDELTLRTFLNHPYFPFTGSFEASGVWVWMDSFRFKRKRFF